MQHAISRWKATHELPVHFYIFLTQNVLKEHSNLPMYEAPPSIQLSVTWLRHLALGNGLHVVMKAWISTPTKGIMMLRILSLVMPVVVARTLHALQ